MHMHHLETLYQFYEVNDQSGVIWGHSGQKVKFAKKRYKSYIFHTRSLDLNICISLRHSINVMGSKVSRWSFGVTGVKRSNSPKIM